MTRYKQNGGLTQFDEGKLHSQNPLGGVPIGNNNSVEQGETLKDNFVYSNRIFLDSNIVSQYNLPKSLVGKSVADATKFIDNKFKGRNDKISQSTKNGMLSKIAEAQESMKPQEPEIERPQEGMEQSQMAYGGNANRYESGQQLGDTFTNMAITGADMIMPGAGQVLKIGDQLGQTVGESIKGDHGESIGGLLNPMGTIRGLGSALKTGNLNDIPAIGIFGGQTSKQKLAIENANNSALNTNRKYSDQYALGGNLGGPGKKIKNPDGSYSMVNTSTRQVTPGSIGTTIPGKPGSPAILPTPGVNSTDIGRNKAFAAARAAGQPTFMYNGKSFTTEMSGTPGRPAINPTPDIVTPSVPPTYETNTLIEPIPNQVYNIQAQRGTAGTGMLRPGIGGGITTDNQYTANQDVANRALNAQQIYNEDVNRRYAPVLDDGRSNNSAQLANRNAKAELRRQQLQGTATANEIPTQLGLERKKVEALRNNQPLAYGGKMNKMADGGSLDEIFKVKQNLYPQSIQNLKSDNSVTDSSVLKQYNNEILNPGLFNTQKTLDGDRYSLENRLGRFGTAVNDNAGNIARYAPIAANALQLAQLKKPQGERLDRLGNRYKPEYVDEAALQNIADQTMNNSVNAIGQSGASQGQLRSSIVGSQLQRTKAISDAYSQAAAQNRQQNAMAQEFNLGVDQVNLQQSNSEKDINARNKGAYDTEKSKLIGKIGENIGNVGTEQAYKKIAVTTTGYNWLGEFQKMNPNATKEETVIAAKKAGVTIDDDKTVKKQALGGYLIKNKVK